MAHVYRFFGQRDSSNIWVLDADEAHHAIKVLRLQDGETVEVMDGAGRVALGPLMITSKSKAALAPSAAETFTPKDLFCRCIIMGALKPGDMDDLIAPLVELGVDQLIVFHQSETPQYRASAVALERWKRLVRSAMKQSKRPWHVEIRCVASLSAALDLTKSLDQRWMLTREADTDALREALQVSDGCGLAMLIGGEKGLSRVEESMALDHGFKAVGLGPWVLRARTAAQAAAVFLGMMPQVLGKSRKVE